MAEGVLSDSQYGFRSGRGCVDLIFSTRQLLEKTIEHQSKLFMLFVDLRKAYDSVPRCALWKILEQYGVPEVMIGLLRSLHDGMEAEVTIGGCTSATFSVTNRLRQGCTIAPTLFALYLNRVIECWWGRCESLGVKVFYKYGGKLVGERTRKPLSFEITELLFADDGVMVCCTRKDMEEAARVFDEVAAEFGLTVSVIKTKLLVAGCDIEEEDLAPLYIRGQLVEQVQSFKYLGSFVETSGSVLLDVQDKIGRASRVFGALHSAVFCDGSLSLSTKRMVYCSMVLGVLLYGAESWAIKERTIRKIESFHNRCMRCILGVSRADQRIRHLTSEQIRAMFGMETSMKDLLSIRRLRWLGHTARKDDVRIPKRLLFGWLPHSRPAHGAKLRWRDKVRQDLKRFCIAEAGWYCLAQDRTIWRDLCQQGLKNVQNAVPSTMFACYICHRQFRRR